MTLYRCTVCGNSQPERLVTRGIDPRYASGLCIYCRLDSFFRLIDPETAKQRGIATVEQSAGQGVDAAWRAEAVAAARKLVARGLPFTAEDVAAAVGRPAHHPNLMGALMNALKEQGVIEHAGFDRATRPESHGRWIQMWRGKVAA